MGAGGGWAGSGGVGAGLGGLRAGGWVPVVGRGVTLIIDGLRVHGLVDPFAGGV